MKEKEISEGKVDERKIDEIKINEIKMEDRAGELIQRAVEARENAYCPYSGYAVGAAVLTEKGEIFTGCNVENASYGLTNCGERTAIFSAVSRGARKIKAIAISGSGTPPYPCGACRQVMAEFAESGDMPVYVVLVGEDGKAGQTEAFTLKELLPRSFNLL